MINVGQQIKNAGTKTQKKIHFKSICMRAYMNNNNNIETSRQKTDPVITFNFSTHQ